MTSESNYWDSFPEDTIVRTDEGRGSQKIGGSWHEVASIESDEEPFTQPATVIYIPVTDQEPPAGSVAQDHFGTLWTTSTTGWCRVTDVESDPDLRIDDPWASLRPDVTRILRWGAR